MVKLCCYCSISINLDSVSELQNLLFSNKSTKLPFQSLLFHQKYPWKLELHKNLSSHDLIDRRFASFSIIELHKFSIFLFEYSLIHPKSKNVCGFCFSVQKNHKNLIMFYKKKGIRLLTAWCVKMNRAHIYIIIKCVLAPILKWHIRSETKNMFC